MSVNHAPVEDPGHHAALLVVELQRDSLEDRKIHDRSLEGRAPMLSAKSSPGPRPRWAAQWLGGSPLLGQPSLLQLLLAQASPPFDGARSGSPGRRWDPAPSSRGRSVQRSPASPEASLFGTALPAPPSPWVPPPSFGILPALTMGSSVTFSNWMRRIFRTSRPLLWEGLPRVAEPLV